VTTQGTTILRPVSAIPLTRGRIIVGLMVANGLAFAPSLWGDFVFDDRNDITTNPSAQAETFAERLPAAVRPLSKATYAAQDALHGMNAAAFHAFNLALHLGCVVLVFLLLLRVARLSGADDKRATVLAAVSTLLWSLHPALTETVSYISGRSVGLSSLLMLGALLAAIGERPRPLLAFFCALLAPLARETALIAPVLLLAFQITVGRNLAPSRMLPVWIGALSAAVTLALMPSHRDLVSFSLEQRGPLDAMRANVFALPEILSFWVTPWTISVLPAQVVTHGWADTPTLIRLGGLMLIPSLALLIRKRNPLAAFALLFTLLVLVPTNSIIWRVDPVAIRPLYLAGIGISLIAALGLSHLRFGVWIALALALWLGAMTFQRTLLYRDEVALFADASEKSPEASRPLVMLGLALANAGREADAREVLKRALTVDPFDAEAANALRLLDAGGSIYSNPAP
jgi:protein O-mannosyl-transferase